MAGRRESANPPWVRIVFLALVGILEEEVFGSTMLLLFVVVVGAAASCELLMHISLSGRMIGEGISIFSLLLFVASFISSLPSAMESAVADDDFVLKAFFSTTLVVVVAVLPPRDTTPH